MKTSLQWLADFLPNALDPQIAADALTNGGLPVESMEKQGDSTLMDVEVTSNRSDCLSHVGVARELAALLDRPFKDVTVVALKVTDAGLNAFEVQIEAANLCPHYTARVIRGVKIGPSPAWLAQRLEAVGIRPVNNVVDITNYVMFEMGQPLHAFDFAKLSGKKIVVRLANKDEKFISIDGKTRELKPDMLVIADAIRPVALAGVMGGLDSEVSPQTTDILLESARFDALSVRKTARALAMKSESSYRFERGIDPTLPRRASLRATQLILEIAGGTPANLVEAGAENHQALRLSLRLPRLKQVLGVELPPEQVVDAFRRLGLSPSLQDNEVRVTVPSHRLDITQEIDLVEEAARVIGYDKIPMREEISIRLAPPQPSTITLDTIAQTLVASGYFEAVTFSFITDSLRRDFIEGGSRLLRADSAVRKADAALRPSLIPGLLEAVRHNETAGTSGAKLFEIGSAFSTDASGKLKENRRLALAGGADYRDVRGMVETVLGRLDADRAVAVIPKPRAGFANGASGEIRWGDEPIGCIGRIDRSIAEKLSLREAPFAAEVDLEPLLTGARHVPQLRELAKFPAVRRDLSFVVQDATPYESIQSLVHGLGLEFLEAVEFVTTYKGKPLEPGTKSVTITLIFRSCGATLTSEQVEASVQKAIDAARTQLNASLRT